VRKKESQSCVTIDRLLWSSRSSAQAPPWQQGRESGSARSPASRQPSETAGCNLYTFYYYAKCFLGVLLTFTTNALWNEF